MENKDSCFDIKVTEGDDHIFLVASGEYSLIKANNLFKCSIDQALLSNKRNILIDVTNITGHIPLFDRYEFADSLANYKARHALIKIKKIAVVGHEPIMHKDRFGEVVANNRGLNGRGFTDMDEARAWLK